MLGESKEFANLSSTVCKRNGDESVTGKESVVFMSIDGIAGSMN